MIVVKEKEIEGDKTVISVKIEDGWQKEWEIPLWEGGKGGKITDRVMGMQVVKRLWYLYSLFEYFNKFWPFLFRDMRSYEHGVYGCGYLIITVARARCC